MRTQLFASLATLRIGMDVLQTARACGWTGCSRTAGCSRPRGWRSGFLAAAIDTPVSVGDVAAEGGAWGMAVLAAFMRNGRYDRLGDYLATEVFQKAETETVVPVADYVTGFDVYMDRHRRGLPIERAAIEALT